MITVVFFQRKPLAIHKSIEFIFEDIRQRLTGQVDPAKKIFSFYSKGIISRLKIIYEAYRNQGDINHVTGDIHFAAILLKKKKTILTIHDCGMLTQTKGIKRMVLQFFWFTLPLRKCCCITVVSHTTRNELLKYVNYPEKNIHVIPVPISGKFVYTPRCFNAERPTVLQYCTTPNKNALQVVRALKDIPCELILVGGIDDALLEELQKSGIPYTNYNNIPLDDLVELYKKCDLLCFASTYEGFGMPIVEAQAVGRPVIAGNLSSMPEVAGDGACLVDPFNITDIRNGVLKVINNESYREGLIQKGLENCRRFNADAIAGQYLALYKKIASG
ncbi:MAG: glycosyltransferase family 4 protein [Chitinophagaceae bacterium]|nr:glycosyltransferase family 4 protein [Chitinophagaceae bacterium]